MLTFQSLVVALVWYLLVSSCCVPGDVRSAVIKRQAPQLGERRFAQVRAGRDSELGLAVGPTVCVQRLDLLDPRWLSKCSCLESAVSSGEL